MKQISRVRKLVIIVCFMFGMLVGFGNILTQPVTVSAETKKASLNKSVLVMEIGQSSKIKLKGMDFKKVKKVTWSTSDKNVAKVSSTGIIKAIKSGASTIKCLVKYNNGKKQNLKCNILVREKSKVGNEKSIVGAWFSDSYIQEDGHPDYYTEFELDEDGTGRIVAYDCLNVDPDSECTSSDDGRDIVTFTWKIRGNVFTILTYDGQMVNFDYKYSKEKGTLVSLDGYIGYSRKMPKVPTNREYETRIYDLYNKEHMEKRTIMERLKGLWYFDMTEWTFNDDGTGVLYIPKIGPGKEKKRKFTYDVFATKTYDTIYLTITFPDDGTEAGFYVKRNGEDGSMSFENSKIVLKRNFDMNNCPLTKEIVQNNLDVLSGNFFDDWLSKYKK